MGKACSTNEEKRNAYRILVENPERKRPLGRPDVQLEYLVATLHGKLRSGRAGPFVKVEGCCD
jgi:hypothetical protein